MQFRAIILSLALSTGLAAASRTCTGQSLYCGSTLDWRGWSNQDIWGGIRKGGRDYPDDLNESQFPNTLFECDGRSGDDALWYLARCAKCIDGGAGHSDYCAS